MAESYGPGALICIPTYNEAEKHRPHSCPPRSRRCAAAHAPEFNRQRRPIGTASLLDELAAADARQGLGPQGQGRAWERPVSQRSRGRSRATTAYVFELDADFSHHPGYPAGIRGPARQ